MHAFLFGGGGSGGGVGAGRPSSEGGGRAGGGAVAHMGTTTTIAAPPNPQQPPYPPAQPQPSPPPANADAAADASANASSTPAATHASAFGVCLRQGRRSTMEDAAGARWILCPRSGKEIGLFGVFDGHGGDACVRFVSRELLGAVAAHASFPSDLEQALVSAFEATDARYLEQGERRAAARAAGAPPESPPKKQPATLPPRGGAHGQITAASAPPGDDGSTAVVAVLLADGTLAVANCGDSRAVLMRGGRAHTLSVDHKPNVREERLRVEKAGGAVIWSGVWRVGAGSTAAGGGGGLLATSRAFGDRPLKLGAGVIVRPDVRVTRLGAGDEVLVLASDGLWDVMNAQEALMIAREEGCAAAGARRLAREAVERGSLDNVAVLVVRLGGFGGDKGGDEEGGGGENVASGAEAGKGALPSN